MKSSPPQKQGTIASQNSQNTATISVASTNSISRGGSSGQHTGTSSYATSTNIWAKLLGGNESVWDGLSGREDVYDDPDEGLDENNDLISTKSRYEDEGICGTAPLKLCCLSTWYETRHFFRTLWKHPVIILVSLAVFGLVCGLGMWAVESERESYVKDRMDTAKFVARETADYFANEFRRSMVPLYALREAIQYSGYFDALPDLIGNYPANLQAENVAILGGDMTQRNITGICDQPEVLDNWKSMVTKISDEHDLNGLIFRYRLWPKNVACLEFKGGNAMMDSGMDASESPHPFWSQVVIDIQVDNWEGLHVFGPFQAELPFGVADVFCTHIPLWTSTTGENAFKDVVNVQGTPVQNVWGFTMLYLNWSEMKKRSNMYERFEDVNMEFELFREEEPRLGDVGPKGLPTKEMTKLAWSEQADKLNESNSVEIKTESLHGIWINRVGVVGDSGWNPEWWPAAVASVVVGAFILMVLTAMTMVKSYLHKDLVKRMLPKQAIRKLQRGQTVVEKYNIVTVFFADIVGYTGAAGSMRPAQVMKMLNELYTELDKLAEKHQVYKVETVGNQYMVVAGAPHRVTGRVGAQRVALFALDAINFVSKYQTKEGDKILIRAGMASGPTVAGVVGQAMPRYCFFGETVDYASKMESTSKKMKIQVSEMTYRLLLDCVNLKFVMTKRMEGGIAGVEIKGKGQQITFWIEKASPCERCFELATGSFALVPCGHIMCAACNEKYKMFPCPTCRCKVDDRVEWKGKPTKIVDESVEVEHAPHFDEEAGLTSEQVL
mmetsp:Transcript_304/g.582  ORF Transcript_304/g.582 Transcript_304/m.582 type:complete len:781 (-) Transcript_304:106-2448(-)